MTHRILKAVLLRLRVEVASGGLEVGRIAERFRVNVYAVIAWGQVFEVELDCDLAAFIGYEGGGASIVAGARFEGGDDRALGCGKDWDGKEANSECGEGVAHRNRSPINVFL